VSVWGRNPGDDESRPTVWLDNFPCLSVEAIHESPLHETGGKIVKNLKDPLRRSLRLQGYDYSQAGAYYVTVCTRDREFLFGDVVRGQMQINEVGRIVETTWRSLPQFYAGIELDGFIIMPNHVHGIVIIRSGVGGFMNRPYKKTDRCALGSAGVCCFLK